MGKLGKSRADAKDSRKPKAKKGGYAAAGRPGRRPWPVRVLAWLLAKSLKWGTVAAVWGLIGFLGLAAWYGTELPDVDQAFNATRRPTGTLLSGIFPRRS